MQTRESAEELQNAPDHKAAVLRNAVSKLCMAASIMLGSWLMLSSPLMGLRLSCWPVKGPPQKEKKAFSSQDDCTAVESFAFMAPEPVADLVAQPSALN